MALIKIISVNNSLNERYTKRRDVVQKSIKNIKDAYIFDAIKHDDWIRDGDIIFNNKNIPCGTEHDIYVSNFLSHYEIWKEGNSVLILEDDIIIKNNIIDKIDLLIKEFDKIEGIKILYLQSSCPWRTGLPLKNYNITDVETQIGNFYKLKNTVFDVSGTAAYYIDSKTSKFLENSLNTSKIFATDCYLHNLLKNGVVDYYIPTDFQNCFKLDINLQ
jgi:GR25 family glycosyltransferase involved in LPS biosynthesis